MAPSKLTDWSNIKSVQLFNFYTAGTSFSEPVIIIIITRAPVSRLEVSVVLLTIARSVLPVIEPPSALSEAAYGFQITELRLVQVT